MNILELLPEIDVRSADWMEEGECRFYDKDLLHPEGNSVKYQEQIAQGKAVCAECPVRQQCLEWAEENHEYYGTWGGLTEWERKERRKVTNPGMKRKLPYSSDGRIDLTVNRQPEEKDDAISLNRHLQRVMKERGAR